MRRLRAWGRSLVPCLQPASREAPGRPKRQNRCAGAATLLHGPRFTISTAQGPIAGLPCHGLAVQHLLRAARAARAAAGRPEGVPRCFLENARAVRLPQRAFEKQAVDFKEVQLLSL